MVESETLIWQVEFITLELGCSQRQTEHCNELEVNKFWALALMVAKKA